MNELKNRKNMRLRGYNYSTKGAYFVTICTQNRRKILSEITPTPVGVGALDDPIDGNRAPSVGVGAPDDPIDGNRAPSVGVGALDDPICNLQTRLTPIGAVVEKHLLSSTNIPGVKIDRYVIMPDHLHVIIFLNPEKYAPREDGSSRAPTPTNEMLPRVISAFKHLCSREIGENVFQRGYMEHIIRDQADYDTRVKYIYENPLRWYYDKQ